MTVSGHREIWKGDISCFSLGRGRWERGEMATWDSLLSRHPAVCSCGTALRAWSAKVSLESRLNLAKEREIINNTTLTVIKVIVPLESQITGKVEISWCWEWVGNSDSVDFVLHQDFNSRSLLLAQEILCRLLSSLLRVTVVGTSPPHEMTTTTTTSAPSALWFCICPLRKKQPDSSDVFMTSCGRFYNHFVTSTLTFLPELKTSLHLEWMHARGLFHGRDKIEASYCLGLSLSVTLVCRRCELFESVELDRLCRKLVSQKTRFTSGESQSSNIYVFPSSEKKKKKMLQLAS